MDDFDAGPVESAGLSLASVMSNAAPMHDEKISSQSVRCIVPSVTEDRYMKATPAQIEFNVGVSENKNKDASKVLDLLDMTKLEKKNEIVFCGRVEQDSAKKLASTLVKYYDAQNGGVKLQNEKVFPGFTKYADHLGRHDDDAQQKSSVVFRASYLNKCEKEWPEMSNIFKIIVFTTSSNTLL